ncbi:MAG: MSMEG_0568 family radical SAM protein [Deltaproteobacteria bacterium]|nr:MSMEG_0568 family radical SAM protein [Deltaproteobacteria bacterium]
MMDFKKTCVDLQSCGVRVQDCCDGRKGGAGPSEGQVIIIKGHHLSVPTQSWYVESSPYELRFLHNRAELFCSDSYVCPVELPASPAYYKEQTSEGVLLELIALIHGKACLASTVFQDCVYWNSDDQCLFCGIGLSLANGTTILEKKSNDIGYAAGIASAQGAAEHVTLTTGMRSAAADTVAHLCACVRAIKAQSGLPVHVQICPLDDLHIFDQLKDAGVDTVGIHVETGCAQTLQRTAPAKFSFGNKSYLDAWKYAVDVFGENQVSSFIIAGMGENDASILDLAGRLCELGVFPYLLPLRPVPGTAMEKCCPPDSRRMYGLYVQVAALLKENGMTSSRSKAGCVRCGSCSALALFEA